MVCVCCRGVEIFEHGCDFGVRHEVLPNKTGAIVFDHHYDGRLIQSHVNGRDPVGSGIDGVAEAVDAPHGVAEVTVVVLERGHGGFRRVRERCECSSGSDVADVIGFVWGLGRVSARAVARSETPRIGTVAGVVRWIRGRIRAIDESDVPIVIEVRSREAIVERRAESCQ